MEWFLEYKRREKTWKNICMYIYLHVSMNVYIYAYMFFELLYVHDEGKRWSDLTRFNS